MPARFRLLNDEGEQHEISPQQARELAQSGEAQLVDVRTDHEWVAGHVAGATHIELDELSARAAELDRDRQLVFYCRGGNRSGMAVQAFREAGFDVAKVAGGLGAWAQAGLPLEPEDGYVAESGDAAATLEARRRSAGQT